MQVPNPRAEQISSRSRDRHRRGYIIQKLSRNERNLRGVRRRDEISFPYCLITFPVVHIQRHSRHREIARALSATSDSLAHSQWP